MVTNNRSKKESKQAKIKNCSLSLAKDIKMWALRWVQFLSKGTFT